MSQFVALKVFGYDMVRTGLGPVLVGVGGRVVSGWRRQLLLVDALKALVDVLDGLMKVVVVLVKLTDMLMVVVRSAVGTA